jgi:glycosyltransferase involved in cell wall biosynthesis
MKVAILLATYNGEKYLEDQLVSILKQDYFDWELYISDDCSTDKTKDIIDKYCSEYPKKIFSVDNSKRFGNARDNFFFLFYKIVADIYFFSDQDDVWLPNKMSVFINTYNALLPNEKEKPVLIHSDAIVVDSSLGTIAESLQKYQRFSCKRNKINSLLIENNVVGCTVLVNNELKQKFLAGNISEIDKDKIIMHDWYFALIASEFGYIRYIKNPLIKYRQHQDNTIGVRQRLNIKRLIEKLFDLNSIYKEKERIKEQAYIFQKCYSDKLSQETNRVIDGLIHFRKMNIFDKYKFVKRNKMFSCGLINIIKLFVFYNQSSLIWNKQ